MQSLLSGFLDFLFSVLALISVKLSFLQVLVALLIFGILTVIFPHLLIIGKMKEKIRPVINFFDKMIEFMVPELKSNKIARKKTSSESVN